MTPMARQMKAQRRGPDGERFVWGAILDVHEVGRYQIVEAEPNDRVADTPPAARFHVYVDCTDVCLGASALDEALLVAVAVGNVGRLEGATAARYMAKIAGVLPQ